MIVNGLALLLGTESASHENDFTELVVGIVHKNEILFIGNDFEQDFLSPLGHFEPLGLVSTFAGEDLGRLGRKGDRQQVVGGGNRWAGRETLDVQLQIFSALSIFLDLELAHGPTIDGRLGFGELRRRIFGDKIRVARDRFLIRRLATRICCRKDSCFRGVNLRTQTIHQHHKIRRQLHSLGSVVQIGESLVVFANVELTHGELNSATLHQNIRRITFDDFVIRRCGIGIIGVC